MMQATIGNIMSVAGIILVVYTVLIYPVIAKYLGPERGFRVGIIQY